MPNEPIAVTLLVIDALDALGVPYLIGGSLASAVHGVLRATLDTDLVARALGGTFYVDAESIREAVLHRRSFNIIHLETMFKVDVFVVKERSFHHSQMERRMAQVIATDPDRTAYVATAEDTILAKLEWYRTGGDVSERQWRDVLGVMKVQADRLDLAYLRQWAAQLNVSDLLERAIKEAGFMDADKHG
jgi:hypothetical protein